MALSLNSKKDIVDDLSSVLKNSHSVVVADFRGVCVNDLNGLRKISRKSGVRLRVVRNTLASRVFSGTEYECLKDYCSGPTMIAFSQEHPGSAARIFRDFSKDRETFSIKAASFEGGLVDVEYLSKLPTFEEAVAKIALLIKEASVAKIARLISLIQQKNKEDSEQSDS